MLGYIIKGVIAEEMDFYAKINFWVFIKYMNNCHESVELHSYNNESYN